MLATMTTSVDSRPRALSDPTLNAVKGRGCERWGADSDDYLENRYLTHPNGHTGHYQPLPHHSHTSPPQGTSANYQQPQECLLPGGFGGARTPHQESSAHSTLRSMYNGMATTVPQSMVQHDLNSCHRPSVSSSTGKLRVRPLKQRPGSPRSRRETFEMRCCRINVLLVTMQMCLGVGVTALGFYMHTLTPTLLVRECPYWAGIPLLVAGIVGIYFCATDFASYSGSMKAFIIKATCFILSAICIFLCMVAAVFPGIHGDRIASYAECNDTANFSCSCSKSETSGGRVFIYQDVGSCTVVLTSVKDYLILQCALNAIASGVCLWFVTLLWKSRYEDFHSGLRFYSYSASVPPHPWSNPSSPPYGSNPHSHPPSPIPIYKLGTRRSETSQSRENTQGTSESLSREEIS